MTAQVPVRPSTARPATAAPSARATATALRGGRPAVGAAIGLLAVFEFVSGFLQTCLVPLLPDLGARLDISQAGLNLVTAAQLLSAAVCTPILGRLGDLRGHRAVLRGALLAIAAGTALVAAAPNLPLLLAGRVLQGPIAALLPLEIALVRARTNPQDGRRAIGRLIAALTLGALLGGVGAGVLDKALGGLGPALWIPALLAAACAALSFRLPAATTGDRTAADRTPLDWPGAALLSLAMLGLLLGLSTAQRSGPHAPALLPLAAGAALLAVFARRQLRVPHPLVDLRALAARRVAPFYAAAFLFGVYYFGNQTVTSTFLATDPHRAGYGFGLSALRISLTLLPMALFSVLASTRMARLAHRIGYRSTLTWGFACTAASFLIDALAHQWLWPLLLAGAIGGVGLGLALGAMPTVIVEAGDPADTATSGAVYGNVKTLGGATAGGLFAALLGSVGHPLDGTTPSDSAYTLVWLLCAACALAAIALVRLTARPGRRSDA